MNEPKYRKIKCSMGHWCNPVSLNDILPKQCPICQMPYDRRHNKPVFCFEDGTLPEETETNEIVENEITPPETEVPEQPIARRRRIIGNSSQSAGTVPVERKSYYSPSTNSGLVLKCGQYSISVSEEGIYLGREENGREIFGADFMISRRHCFVRKNRFDEVLITDANSLNGTFIDNGTGRRRIGNDETVTLKVGQKLYLADFVLIVDKS